MNTNLYVVFQKVRIPVNVTFVFWRFRAQKEDRGTFLIRPIYLSRLDSGLA
jgi:hypothetical protein